ncbi:hypothetical protein FE391_39685 [Nonomuraea sp. KC401]|uniref:hypothetical protein n=1 Tax=unclassified Nonomuraea TaxID=2593643 RepID=UPI0010FE2CFF|nr:MULTISPECIES: hypothetical protein [unclassified Nonomuraea]NBE94786.1 hypothetical protein [Nonomuraea sp. K271]TLF56217.1 hypothetical protein FE391_39685 [Nonomuraea sp. KC401]
MSAHDLRDVLRERAEAPAPANPHRHDQIRARVRRARIRRRVLAGTAVAAAAVLGVSLIPGAADVPAREITAAAGPASSLPETFTSGDGTEYRRVATAELKAEPDQKTSVTVPVSGKPLDAAGLCAGKPTGQPPHIRVNGELQEAGFLRCGTDMELKPLVVPEGATEITVTFDTVTSGYGCVSDRKGGKCRPQTPHHAAWRLGVYEWTPPAEPVEPEEPRAFPARLGGMKLAAKSAGVWDDDRSFELVVESPGGKLGLEQLCTGDLAGRMWFTYRINGEDSGVTADCATWKSGPFPLAMGETTVPKGGKVRITGKVGLRGEATNRPVRWSVAAYVK